MLTRSRGGILKTMLWLLAAVSLAIAALVGVNFLDEDLSTAAREAMTVAEPPPASERNGYVHFLAMGATGRESSYAAGLRVLAGLRTRNMPGFKDPPQADDTLTLQNIEVDAAVPKCMPEEKSCLEAAASSTDLEQVIALHSDRLERYRAMRELPEFVDLYYPTSESAPLPAYQGLLSAQQLSLLKAAVAANAGRHAEALQEMEVEAALAGPLGAAHPDPYTGLPMRFDPKNSTIGFESNSQRGSIIEKLKKRYGRVAVPIV